MYGRKIQCSPLRITSCNKEAPLVNDLHESILASKMDDILFLFLGFFRQISSLLKDTLSIIQYSQLKRSPHKVI